MEKNKLFDKNDIINLDHLINNICEFYHHYAHPIAQGLLSQFNGYNPTNEYKKEGIQSVSFFRLVRDFRRIPVRGIYLFGSQIQQLTEKVNQLSGDGISLPDGITIENDQIILHTQGYPLFYEFYNSNKDLDVFVELDINENYFLPSLPERHAWFRTIKFWINEEHYLKAKSDSKKKKFIDLYSTENGELADKHIKISTQPFY